jgi:hypothetical protein
MSTYLNLKKTIIIITIKITNTPAIEFINFT